MTEPARSILIAGGSIDPHLGHLNKYLRHTRGVEPLRLAVGKGKNPTLSWDLDDDALLLDGQRITPGAVFLRHDVFSEEMSARVPVIERAYTWYVAVASWLESHPEVRIFNRKRLGRTLWKPSAILRAKACGLAVPETLVSNDVRRVKAFTSGAGVAKPIDGGDYCRRLSAALRDTQQRGDAAAQPAIVQPELVPPEVRVYGIAGSFFGFRVSSCKLDYRADSSARVEILPVIPGAVKDGLARLMDDLHLDFCAADFKTHPVTGELIFLEINDAPMFQLFDEVAGGAIAGAIADFLQG